MASTKEHRDKAEHNEFLVTSLQNPFWDWAVTGTFYAAVHYVEAYFSKNKPPIHSTSHKDRDSRIQRDQKLKAVYNSYRELQNESRDARYSAHIVFTQDDVKRLQVNLQEVKNLISPLIK